MTTSEETKELFEALIAFNKEVGPIAKDSKNPDLRNKYASLDQIISTTKPLLGKHGLGVIQPLNNGGVTTILFHKSGQWVKTYFAIEVKEFKRISHAQAVGVSITYCRRYSLGAILNLATEEDTDGAGPTPTKTQAARTSTPRKNLEKVYKISAATKKFILALSNSPHVDQEKRAWLDKNIDRLDQKAVEKIIKGLGKTIAEGKAREKAEAGKEKESFCESTMPADHDPTPTNDEVVSLRKVEEPTGKMTPKFVAENQELPLVHGVDAKLFDAYQKVCINIGINRVEKYLFKTKTLMKDQSYIHVSAEYMAWVVDNEKTFSEQVEKMGK